MKNSVCAVVVLYNGDTNTQKNIESLIGQTEHIVLVDNNSTEDMTVYYNLVANCDSTIIKNEENRGIATALNQGARVAIDKEYKYILTMDQDSILDDNAVQIMLDLIESDSKVGIVAPNVKQKKFNETSCEHAIVITSGSLQRTEVYQQADGFDDKLFIDAVDFDFCFRVRSLGYKVIVARDAKMQHSLGKVIPIRLLFFTGKLSIHNTFRYYYIERNTLYVCKKYEKQFPKDVFIQRLKHFKNIALLRMYHPQKKEMNKQLKRGQLDYKKGNWNG